MKDAERFAARLRELRSKLNDEQLDALDELMEGLFLLDANERRRVIASLIEHLKEIIENQKPVN